MNALCAKLLPSMYEGYDKLHDGWAQKDMWEWAKKKIISRFWPSRQMSSWKLYINNFPRLFFSFFSSTATIFHRRRSSHSPKDYGERKSEENSLGLSQFEGKSRCLSSFFLFCSIVVLFFLRWLNPPLIDTFNVLTNIFRHFHYCIRSPEKWSVVDVGWHPFKWERRN